jgi:pyruvate kinase
MSKNLSKYLYRDMDKQAGLQHTFHKTKIVATVGPSCDTYDKLLELVKAGVNVFRLNFSHGTHEDKAKVIEHIRNINLTEPYNISILGDLQGPKLRVGDIKDGALTIVPGDILTFTSREKVIGTKDKIYLSYPNLHHDVQVGNKIMIDDGKLEVVVVNVDPNGDVKVAVTYGGVLLPKKGVNLPDTKISLPAITDKDVIDLAFIIEQKLDWVALSFVRKADDIIDLKARLAEKKSQTKVIAKIEMPSALEDLRNIVLESDAVMVARGDLAWNYPWKKYPWRNGKLSANPFTGPSLSSSLPK